MEKTRAVRGCAEYRKRKGKRRGEGRKKGWTSWGLRWGIGEGSSCLRRGVSTDERVLGEVGGLCWMSGKKRGVEGRGRYRGKMGLGERGCEGWELLDNGVQGR